VPESSTFAGVSAGDVSTTGGVDGGAAAPGFEGCAPRNWAISAARSILSGSAVNCGNDCGEPPPSLAGTINGAFKSDACAICGRSHADARGRLQIEKAAFHLAHGLFHIGAEAGDRRWWG
jgi:hypothetical protein